MKVLAVTAIYPSAEKPAFGTFVRAQVEALREAGVEVDVFVLQGRNRKLMYPKAIFELRQWLNKTSYDLIHTHYGYVGIVGRTQFRCPVVMTFHGSDILGGINQQGKRTFFSHFEVLSSKIVGALADAVIVQTRQMANQFRRKDVHVISHEVNLDLFHPIDREQARQTLGLDPHKKYLLFAAHPDNAVKRFPLAQAAAEALKQQDKDVELLVVYKETQERLNDYMNACDALVFPSYQEGSPNIIKQALACNLPLVATDVGDVRDMVGDTQQCYICPPTADAFADKLRLILETRQRSNGREKVQHLSAPLVAERIIRVYERTIGNHGKS